MMRSAVNHATSVANASIPSSACWSRCNINLRGLVSETEPFGQRCAERYATLDAAKAACEELASCGGVVKDNGITCDFQKLAFELRIGSQAEASLIYKPPDMRGKCWLLRRPHADVGDPSRWCKSEGAKELTEGESALALQARVERLKRSEVDPKRVRVLTRSLRFAMLAKDSTRAAAALQAAAALGQEAAAGIVYGALEQAHAFDKRAGKLAGEGSEAAKPSGPAPGAEVATGQGSPASSGQVAERVEGYSSKDELFAHRRYFWHEDVRVMCETGFNGGHSSANYLLSNFFGLNMSYVGFDLGEHAYAHHALDFVATLFPGRVRVVWGDSAASLRKIASCRRIATASDKHPSTDTDPQPSHPALPPPNRRSNPGQIPPGQPAPNQPPPDQLRCDGVMVDGLHTYAGALADLHGFLPLTPLGARVAIDDISISSVKRAWDEVVAQGAIEQAGCSQSMGQNYCMGRRAGGPLDGQGGAAAKRRGGGGHHHRLYSAQDHLPPGARPHLHGHRAHQQQHRSHPSHGLRLG